MDALARRVDEQVVAPGHGPARDVVLSLLLRGHGLRGTLGFDAPIAELRELRSRDGARELEGDSSANLQRCEELAEALPFVMLDDALGLETSGSVVEDLRVVAIDAECTLFRAALRVDVREQIAQLELSVNEALHLLEGDALIPEQARGLTLRRPHELRRVGPPLVPAWVRAPGVFPLDHDVLEARVERVIDTRAAVRLLVHEERLGGEAQHRLVVAETRAQVCGVHAPGHERRDEL